MTVTQTSATSRDGTTIAVDVRGTGPVLVVVTGATCFRRFAPVVKDAKTFAGTFTVATYDRRGRGDSGDGAAWSLERELEDLEAVIDSVGGEAFVYGHSSGAVIAWHAAHRLSHKIRQTVLYDASWVADEAEAKEYADLRGEVEGLLERGRNAPAIRRFLRGIGMPKVFVALLPLMPGYRTMVALAPTLRYDMALTAGTPELEIASEISSPIHVLVGERSPDSLHAVAGALSGALTGSAVTTVAGQDHMVAAKVLLPLLRERLGQACRQ